MTGVHRHAGGVIGDNDIVERQQPVVQGRWLNVPDIDPRASDLARRQGIRQGVLVGDTATRRGDQIGIRPHQR